MCHCGSTWTDLRGIGDYKKNQNLFKIWLNFEHLAWIPKYSPLLPSTLNPSESCLGLKWYQAARTAEEVWTLRERASLLRYSIWPFFFRLRFYSRQYLSDIRYSLTCNCLLISTCSLVDRYHCSGGSCCVHAYGGCLSSVLPLKLFGLCYGQCSPIVSLAAAVLTFLSLFLYLYFPYGLLF